MAGPKVVVDRGDGSLFKMSEARARQFLIRTPGARILTLAAEKPAHPAPPEVVPPAPETAASAPRPSRPRAARARQEAEHVPDQETEED